MKRTPTTKLGPLDLQGIERLASLMIQYLPSHLVIALTGTLGAGKTTLVQSIARADGIDSSDVTSPTFTLLQTHSGNKRTLHHLDAYRIADEDEFLELGVEELLDEDHAWTLIEWADRVAGVLPAESLWVEIKVHEDGRSRTVRMTSTDPAIAQAIDRVAGEMD